MFVFNEVTQEYVCQSGVYGVENEMNKYGLLSLLMVAINAIGFFAMRGPNANVYVIIIIFTVLSIMGIVFAILSKKWVSIVLGIILNGGVMVIAFFLLLAMGISEP